MSILIDCHLREKMTHDAIVFPITYFDNELAALPNRTGPLHWHPEFEIATADSGVLDFQVGQKHLTLEAGDRIFVNGNILHGMKQLSGDVPDLMPNIVFSGVVVAPETSVIYQKYIQPISVCDVLPF
ncbi:MAG: cupin domain-containing protein, partial [Lachnospiraceae bacterium]|nr:cupin domain-containing protein [Lachnospiraceae bacterium]